VVRSIRVRGFSASLEIVWYVFESDFSAYSTAPARFSVSILSRDREARATAGEAHATVGEARATVGEAHATVAGVQALDLPGFSPKREDLSLVD